MDDGKITILKEFEEEKEKNFFQKNFYFSFDLRKYDAEDVTILLSHLVSLKIKFTYNIICLIIEF